MRIKFLLLTILTSAVILGSAQVALAAGASQGLVNAKVEFLSQKTEEETKLPLGSKSLPALIVFIVAGIACLGLSAKYIIDVVAREREAKPIDRGPYRNPGADPYRSEIDYDDTLETPGGRHSGGGGSSSRSSGGFDGGSSGRGSGGFDGGSSSRSSGGSGDGGSSGRSSAYDGHESTEGLYGRGSGKRMFNEDDPRTVLDPPDSVYDVHSPGGSRTRGIDDEVTIPKKRDLSGDSTLVPGAGEAERRARSTVKLCLVTLKEAHRVSTPKFKDVLLLGRSSTCDVRFDGTEISREQCRLVAKDGKVTLEHLSKSTETWLNNEQVTEPRFISVGDNIKFGKDVSIDIANIQWISASDDTFS
ncbi:MAG: FHA domain-containing protein [Clostridiales bacterium]|nr:FHA domain-containing protein [Clostridiales bacterium]